MKTLLLSLLLPVGFVNQSVAATFGSYEYYISNSEVTITGFACDVSEVVMPLEIEGLPVATIGDRAFYGCNSLTSVTIGNSVTTIGYLAFWGCRNLANVTIGNSVTTIGGFAFNGCISLPNATIPKSVTTIGDSAFGECIMLTSLFFLGSPPSLGGSLSLAVGDVPIVYYIDRSPDWGDTYAGIPTAPFLPSWGVFTPTPSPAGIYVDTGNWLGWLDITNRPWAWNYATESWLYLTEQVATDRHGWIFVPDLKLHKPGLWLYFEEGNTVYAFSYGLDRWLFVIPGAIEAGAGWIYF